MNHWRVEIDRVSGKVVSCTKCSPGQATEAKFVFYVEAPDEQQAALSGFKLYLATQREAARARKRAYRVLGLCGCGRKPDPGFKQCRTCLDGSKTSLKRKQARARGEDVVTLPKSIAFAARKREEADRVRLETLQEVYKMFMGTKKCLNFLDWIEGQIAKLEGKGKGKKAA